MLLVILVITYFKHDVYEGALQRISYLFDEFDQVVVSFSGGKDSTAILNLALEIAGDKCKLPLPVMFLDQEAEWQSVIDYAKVVMDDHRVKPYWLQVPIRLFNATSAENTWLHCWAEGEQWMREKEPYAIKSNVYGTDRFHDFFPKFLEYHYPDQSVAMLTGVRAEESPNRRAGLTNKATYKHITYGKVYNQKLKHFSFHPLYDWSWRDIWKAIHDNEWSYAKTYDYYYRYGIEPRKMRISNLHHETAVHQLYYLQEIEGETWDKLTKRLGGINQARHFSRQEMFKCERLPYMFRDWMEYRDYLLSKFIQPDKQEIFARKFKQMDEFYAEMVDKADMYQAHITTILMNDFEFTRLSNFTSNNKSINYRKWKNGQEIRKNLTKADLSYIPNGGKSTYEELYGKRKSKKDRVITGIG